MVYGGLFLLYTLQGNYTGWEGSVVDGALAFHWRNSGLGHDSLFRYPFWRRPKKQSFVYVWLMDLTDNSAKQS